jgi:superfamily I DNA/RNA helicase
LAESAAVRAQALELGKTGSVAILSRTWARARSFAKGLPNVRQLNEGGHIWNGEPGIYIGTYHSAKGLEFDSVILPETDSSIVPDPGQVEAFGEAEAMERDARLLYVAITRARSELLATYTRELTYVLPTAGSGYWLQTGGEAS